MVGAVAGIDVLVGADVVVDGVGGHAGWDMDVITVVLLVGAEGVGDIEVVNRIDGEEDEGFANAVGGEDLADDVFA